MEIQSCSIKVFEESASGGAQNPENANEDCPGPQSESAGRSDSCGGCANQRSCAAGRKGPDPDMPAIKEQMSKVKHKILVLSGKGGVGKSTFSAQLSFALADMDYEVGLLDIDICGPSIPKMLGLEGQTIFPSNFGWSPVYVKDNLAVMSMGFRLPYLDDAIIWKSGKKNECIKKFVKDVYWGDLDYLVVDTPPGTSDEQITIAQYLKETGIDGAIIVTTPQQVSILDARREVHFCNKNEIKILGVVENMSGLCQHLNEIKFMKPTKTGQYEDVSEWALACLEKKAPELLQLTSFTNVFDSSEGGAAKMCREMGIPFLGKVPLDPQLCRAAEQGRSCFDDLKCSVSAPALKSIIKKLFPSPGKAL